MHGILTKISMSIETRENHFFLWMLLGFGKYYVFLKLVVPVFQGVEMQHVLLVSNLPFAVMHVVVISPVHSHHQ
jgi:hypothetical protein